MAGRHFSLPGRGAEHTANNVSTSCRNSKRATSHNICEPSASAELTGSMQWIHSLTLFKGFLITYHGRLEETEGQELNALALVVCSLTSTNYPPHIHLSIHPPMHPYIYPSIHSSTPLPTHPLISISIISIYSFHIHPPIHPSTHFYTIYLSIHFIHPLFIHPSIYSVNLPIYPPTHLPTLISTHPSINLSTHSSAPTKTHLSKVINS